MADYFSTGHTVEDLLKAINREDIPSADVTLTLWGNMYEVDFGAHTLSPEDEGALATFMDEKGYKVYVPPEPPS